MCVCVFECMCVYNGYYSVKIHVLRKLHNLRFVLIMFAHVLLCNNPFLRVNNLYNRLLATMHVYIFTVGISGMKRAQ